MRSTHDEVDLDLLVAAKDVVADGVVQLTLRPADDEPLPHWAPGAHVDLTIRPGLVRQYSLCSDPQDRSLWQVAILREQFGIGSQHIHDLVDPGTPIAVRGPRNHFALVDAPSYLFIGGGIGITPLLPMIAEADANGAEWRLVYGGRTRASMAYLDRLVGTYGDKVAVRPQDETGLLDLEGILGSLGEGTAIYCCGPEALLRAVEKHCEGSWMHAALHVERFAPKVIEGASPDTQFEIELAQSGLTLTVPSDQSILRTVELAGVNVLSSCTEGTCGTCETALLAGIADHRDSLLTDEEQAANDTMMICVSRARSARLVLDL